MFYNQTILFLLSIYNNIIQDQTTKRNPYAIYYYGTRYQKILRSHPVLLFSFTSELSFPVTLRSSSRSSHVIPTFRLLTLDDPRLHPTKSERYNSRSQVQTRHQPTLIRGSITKDLCLHRWSHVAEMS